VGADPKPFNIADPLSEEWTRRALELLKSGALNASVRTTDEMRVGHVDGECPYCADNLHCVEPLSAVTEGVEDLLGPKRGAEPAEARYEEFTVTCGCSRSHPGDPKKGVGCGTSFRVAVLDS